MRLHDVDGDGEMVAFCGREHAGLVRALTVYAGDGWVAEELAQETWIRVCRHWPAVRRARDPRAWAYRVALNLANSWGRRRAAERRARDRLAARAAPEDAAGADPVGIAVRDAVRALPRRQREALVLRYFADLPAEEAATLMRCRPATVRALTHQAIATLRTRASLLDTEEAGHAS